MIHGKYSHICETFIDQICHYFCLFIGIIIQVFDSRTACNRKKYILYFYMYLFHVTRSKHLKNIISDGKLKSSNMTGIIDQGTGLYDKNKYVYFSCIDNLYSKLPIYGEVALFFDSKLLYNRNFFVSTVHSPFPEINTTWNKKKDYKKIYKKYYKRTNTVLEKLFKNAVNKLNGEAFQIFQQIAIRNACDLKYLRMIKFINKKPSKKMISIIKKKYPDVIMILD